MIATLTPFLLGRGEPPPTDVLRAMGLAAYGYAVLPAGHTARPALRGDYLSALARHHQIRRQLAPLLAAWLERGIEALVFKGFHLAEFVYPSPGMRFHGDVDVCIRAGRAHEALAVARDQGWAEEGNSLALGRTYSHAICNLSYPGDTTQVDLQRFVLHSHSRANRVQHRVTEAVWARSRTVEWEGTRVRLPHPVDALLVLVLQRAWGDGWGLKPQDPIDMGVLAGALGGNWRERVAERARELGCTHTLKLFMLHCDPEAGRLVLEPPSRAEHWHRDLATTRERPLFESRWMVRARLLPAAARGVAHALPYVLRVHRALRREIDVQRILQSLTPDGAPRRRSSYRTRVRTVRGVRLAMQLFRDHPGGVCLVRALAVFSALRCQGWPVEFVSGIRRAGGKVTGHAWVELEGRVLAELADPHARRAFTVQLRYPPAGDCAPRSRSA